MKAFGIALTLGGTAIGKMTGLKIGGRDVTAIDTTTHGTSGNARTFVGGLIDNGNLEISGDYDPTNTGQDYINANTGSVVAAVVTFTDTTTASFSVVVGLLDIDTDLDGKVTFSSTCKISGVITFT